MNNLAMSTLGSRPPLRVLLVEDDDIDASIVFIFAGMSEKFDFDFTRVTNIAHAREALKSGAFDLCLVDYWVGQETSLRLLTSLDRPGSHTATVVLSNISPRDVEMLRIPSGGATFLSKGDCSVQSLENAVQAALQSRHVRTRMTPALRRRSKSPPPRPAAAASGSGAFVRRLPAIGATLLAPFLDFYLLAFWRIISLPGAGNESLRSGKAVWQVKRTTDAKDGLEGGAGRISNAASHGPAPSVDALLEGIGEGFFALDSDWRFTAFNRAAEEIFSLSRAGGHRQGALGSLAENRRHRIRAALPPGDVGAHASRSSRAFRPCARIAITRCAPFRSATASARRFATSPIVEGPPRRCASANWSSLAFSASAASAEWKSI